MKYSVSSLSLLLIIEFSSSLPFISIAPNSTLVLPCLPPSAPKLYENSISWAFTPLFPPSSSAIPLFPSSHLSHITSKDGSHLSILMFGERDEGTYTCVNAGWKDERQVKLRNSFSVRVFDASAFELLEVKLAKVGDDVQLPCTPPPATSLSPSHSGAARLAVWYRVMQNARKRLCLTGTEKEGERSTDASLRWASSTHLMGDWSILMSNITVEDSGVYQCEWVEDGNLESPLWSQKLELTVQYPPTEPPPMCLGYDTPWEQCDVESSRTSGRTILKESLAEFSFKIFSHLSQSQPSQNILFSPISISWVLTHMLLGARGQTQVDLEMALSLPHSFSCLHKEMKSLTEELKDSVEIASNIYHKPEFKLNQIFINQSQLFYGAVPVKLTNDSEQNVKLVNDWVAEKTNQKITGLMDSVPPSTLLMLINTVYFNGKWKTMFEKKPKHASFLTLSGDIISVPVLYSSKYKLAQRYSADVKAQVAVFPLSGRARLFILLPQSPSQEHLTQLENMLTDVNVRKMVRYMDKAPTEMTEVTLPKIQLDVKTDLMELLETLGLSDLFVSPNLCGLSLDDSDPPLSLSDAQHRAFLSLSEKGVEAGAATSLSFSRSFASFSALRPFVLLLWGDQVDGPLFLGRVAEP
ncbi:hypothetical protein AAFF_G00179750 [Aldrovandia affinis]|uniref:Plasma protease C1 inhibitor n=1 Tax=Aldrovandia affinis TaxID=143900 RepID=A0AAD7WVW2_9TELE|nr:hypothetical protein AAFF_G00179750 [Aldrovandia affinis]